MGKTGCPLRRGAPGAVGSRSRDVLMPGRMEGGEGHGICARKPWAQSPTSQLVFPLSSCLCLRLFPSLSFPICRAGVNSVLPAELGWELNEVPRAPRSVRASGRPSTEGRTPRPHRRQSHATRQLWVQRPFLPPPFSPKLAWGEEREALHRRLPRGHWGCSALRPVQHPEVPALPELGGAQPT